MNQRTLPARWIWGEAVLALFAALNLFIAGQPWGGVCGFGLWGAKAATALGRFDLAHNAFWREPGHAERLRQTLLLDVTSITNIGILAGTLWVAPRRPQDARPLTGAQWAVGLLAGFVLGYSSRLAFGCNMGAMVSGISRQRARLDRGADGLPGHAHRRAHAPTARVLSA